MASSFGGRRPPSFNNPSAQSSKELAFRSSLPGLPRKILRCLVEQFPVRQEEPLHLLNTLLVLVARPVCYAYPWQHPERSFIDTVLLRTCHLVYIET